MDVYSACPTYYGRKNHKGGAVEMLTWQRDNMVPASRYYAMSEEKRRDKILVGILTHNDFPEYTQQYAQLLERAQEGK